MKPKKISASKGLTPDLSGARITCKINGDYINDAMIVKVDSYYYILQNVRSGSAPQERHGYKFGWLIHDGQRPNAVGVTEIYYKQIPKDNYLILS